ncbi:MAG TPA: septal ring lytic transglycosylase RlpA family protein [Bryobacteraceae bacterium]|nr:septal ring lytic transglycosylase RlpA family protein [Bryobacteraceae bacterium]HOQ47045.1 septal ring lytic transglycosylase RlpA family protein [Bryobacteraceae bacterium]HPQ14063.1 septal ring lytic transglycosylase RlpA family protein [Bryobacteraceae bacterium]HPU71082.1 septal ring lytic transglycosylase RlpA family protein [Bryobacteraceae bacterium]
MKRSVWLLIVAVVLFSGCARKRRIPAAAPRIGAEEVGIASWYGYPYHGRATASGEIYDMEKLTAAHRTLPFGTMVRVHNLTNGLSVDVRINDRGPFVKGRIIDLSRAAARKIQMIGPGTAKVRLRVLSLTPSEPACYYGVQVGAFQERANAERLRTAMERRYGSARLIRRDGSPPLWRVVVGRESTMDEAAVLASRIAAETGSAFVVRVDVPETH